MSKKPKTKAQEEPPTEEHSEVIPESHAAGVVDAIEKNRVLVISSAVILLAILAFVLVGKQLGQQKHIHAGMAYTKAATSRDIEALDKVVAEYPGSVSAGNALLSKADLQIDQGYPKDAITTLESMVGSYTTHPRYAQVFYMLANTYHKSGETEKARQNYEKVIEVQADGELTPITRIRLGDLAFAEGNPEKAEQLYEESYTIHPGNPFVPTAENRIAQLKVGNPAEIDRPKPPEPEKKEEVKPNPEAVKKDDPAATKPAPAKKDDPAARKPETTKSDKPAPKKEETAKKGKPKKGDSEEVSAEVEVIEVEQFPASKSMENGIIRNVQIVTPGQEVRPASIRFSDDGTIAEIGGKLSSGETAFDGEGDLFAFPGFIDIHTHGANGFDLSNATLEAVETIAEAKLREGVTTFLPTTWTASSEHIRDMATAAAAYRENQRFARAPFLHVEGPYLNPRQAGAQDPAYMRSPDEDEIKTIHEICPVKIVSLAVELEGALDFVSQMTKQGIVTSAAHSAATRAEFQAARKAGLQHLTHFCNQMSGLHHRDVGLVGSGLLDDEVMIEMICDTIHLCEDMIELVFRHRSPDQIMLITDSIAASHLGDGEYKLGDSKIIVKDGAARIPEGNLAGSTLKFNEALKNVVGICELSLSELSKTTSANQARSLGLSDRGTIEVGMLGDIALLNESFDVEAVFVGGELRYRR